MADISAVKNTLSRKFRGASLDDVQGISNYSLFGEAASNLLAEIDPMETVRHSVVNLFHEIYDYTPPTDLKGKKLLDLRPQVERESWDDFNQTFTEDFDRDKKIKDQQFSVEFNEGSKILRVNKSLTGSIAVNDMTTTTGWTLSSLSNLAVDNVLFSENQASLRFDIGVTGGYLEKNTNTSVDLSDHTNKSSFFRWIYWPDSSIISSISLRIGSSSSNYVTMTGIVHSGSIRNGWNLYRFDWNGGTTTGTITSTAIVYERLTIVSTGSDTDIRIGQLYSKFPYPYESVYYSNALFRPVSGSIWLIQPTSDTDVVNLETEALNLFVYECCVLIASDLQKSSDIKKFSDMLYGEVKITSRGTQVVNPGLYSKYKKDKPSETIRPQSRYYTVNRIRK